MTFIMSKDLIFRVAFWVIFCGMIVIQGIFALRLRLVGERKIADRIAIEREGWSFMIVRFIRSLLLIAFLVLYAVNHPWLVILKIGFPDFVRWMGVALGVLSLALYVWSRLTLGKEWSSCLQMRNQHHLINTGPYARIRHPIYTAMIGFMASITLVTSNGFLMVFLVISVVDLLLRIPREEQMMIDALGDAYITYMQRTGKFIPK